MEQNRENQTNGIQEEGFFFRHRRKRRLIIGSLIVLMFFSLIGGRAMGFRQMHPRSAMVLMGSSATHRAGDFESMGIIFAEAQEIGRNGYGMVHDMLIREASSRGADGIINVHISPTGGIFNRTWTGSALAVRYL